MAQGWGSFLQAARGICKISMKKHKKRRGELSKKTVTDEENENKTTMTQDERDKLRRWDLCYRNQVRIHILGVSC